MGNAGGGLEIGGTIGDYENALFLFALKSLEQQIGEENLIYVLVSYLPVPGHIEEMKTKPTQQAIRHLSGHGIFPDFIFCRAVQPLDEIRKKKIETYANIARQYIISAPDVETIYSIPLNFEKENTGRKILDKFGLKPRRTPEWSQWSLLTQRILEAPTELKIAMVGKYVGSGSFPSADSYLSVNHALHHAAAALNARVSIDWIDAKHFEADPSRAPECLSGYHGILVPGAFGQAGAEGMVHAVRYARENDVPYLGLCFGLQIAVVEFARNVCGMKGANSTEIDPSTPYPVIDILPSQRQVIEESRYGGTMRLGDYAASLKEGSLVFELYRQRGRLEKDQAQWEAIRATQSFRLGVADDHASTVFERHRHRCEVSPGYVEKLEQGGLVFPGYHRREDGTVLMEFIELPGHPYFVACQGHPEFKSRLEEPAPLFYGFIEAALKK